MYIDRISLKDFRTFKSAEIDFVHADRQFSEAQNGSGPERSNLPRPMIPNVNLLLGNNGSGKTTLLKAIAIAALGPAVQDANLPVYRLMRREPRAKPSASTETVIDAEFTMHAQDADHDLALGSTLTSRATITRLGDLERLRWKGADESPWRPIYSADSDAFFFVGYGATRRTERTDVVDPAARQASSFIRAQRIRSLFEEAYSLVPLTAWLPHVQSANPGRFIQIKALITRLLEGTRYEFTGEMEDGEYLFESRGLSVPFPALSDGYRAYLGWIGDLLYHVERTCPSGKKLVENRGIVMVDEIDLHLHPRWQMSVLPTLAKALPNIQFIVTSHSPLLVGSLEWMNLIVMKPGPKLSTIAERVRWAVHGLDADQVLLSDFFGLESTRAPGKKRALKELTLQARSGDVEAAKQLLDEMSRGAEAA
ncbi:MAG TPA: AAA family ATPase [Longimicrobium sp.]|nr:AAA family ATPase [Longimicrobium sp.]